jgi:hypothetical protein
MKLILDFEEINTIKFSTDDDTENSYALCWRPDIDKNYSLWFNGCFVWEKIFENTETAVASVVGSLVGAMKKLVFV